MLQTAAAEGRVGESRGRIPVDVVDPWGLRVAEGGGRSNGSLKLSVAAARAASVFAVISGGQVITGRAVDADRRRRGLGWIDRVADCSSGLRRGVWSLKKTRFAPVSQESPPIQLNVNLAIRVSTAVPGPPPGTPTAKSIRPGVDVSLRSGIVNGGRPSAVPVRESLLLSYCRKNFGHQPQGPLRQAHVHVNRDCAGVDAGGRDRRERERLQSSRWRGCPSRCHTTRQRPCCALGEWCFRCK